MLNRKALFIAGGALLAVLIVAFVVSQVRDRSSATEENIPEINGMDAAGLKAPASIKMIVKNGSNVVATGENLSKVEIWGSIGGKEQILGTAKRTGGGEGGETWTYAVPSGATGIFAIGYNKAGERAARIDLQ